MGNKVLNRNRSLSQICTVKYANPKEFERDEKISKISKISNLQKAKKFLRLNSKKLSKDRKNNLLSEYEINLIRGLWAEMKTDDQSKFGEWILLHVFEVEPQLKFLFQCDNLESSQFLEVHAFKRKVQTILIVIERALLGAENFQVKKLTIFPKIFKIQPFFHDRQFFQWKWDFSQKPIEAENLLFLCA